MPELAGEGRVLTRFRVAREGQTVDGRYLSGVEIQQMAQSYKLSSYTARINVEHIAGYSPDPPFNAYGDVIAVEAVEEDGKFSLYNTISALPNLIALNQAGQKIYPSIEFYRDFAGSGKAYQVGLALTDTPASLGTQPLKLSQQQFALRTLPDTEICMSNLPSAAPAAPAVAATPTAPTEEKTLFAQLKELLTPKAPEPVAAPEDFNATVTQGLVTALNGIAALTAKVEGLSAPAQPATPATQPAAPAAPAGQTAFAVPLPAAAPAQPDPLAALAQQVQQMSQQLQTLATTPVNGAPPQTGPAADATPY